MEPLLLPSGTIKSFPGSEDSNQSNDNQGLGYLIKQRGLKCFRLNVRGLLATYAILRSFFQSTEIYRLFFSQRTTHRRRTEELYVINGYTFISHSRCNDQEDGVAICISERIN